MVESDLRLAAVTNICHPPLVVIVVHVVEAVVLFNTGAVAGSISFTTSKNPLSHNKIHHASLKTTKKTKNYYYCFVHAYA